MIRLMVPSIDEEDVLAVGAVLRTGYLVQGEQVQAFEAAMAARVGTRHAIAVANCTAALHLSLLALGVGPGDRVAVTTYSWPATGNVIALCGAEPVFVDVAADSCAMDPAGLAQAVERGPVKAVMPVHPFGRMADMPRIMAIAAAAGIPVVEDAACALGAHLEGRQAGAWGALGCFSFHPRKAITTGEGGVVTTDDDHLAYKLRVLRNHGLDPGAPAPDFVAPGFNVRLTEFQAALGSSQLGKLDRLVARRRALAARYDALLRDTGVEVPRPGPAGSHVYQSYVVRLPRELAPQRAWLMERLRAQGIETAIGTYHMPLTTYFRQRYGFGPGDFPVTDEVAASALTLPLYETLTEAEQRHVAACLGSQVSAGVPSPRRIAWGASRS